MEDGEIHDSLDYDPALAWPGEEALDNDTVSQSSQARNPKQPVLRFLAQSSSCLKPVQRLAILDCESQVHIGRDAPSEGHKHIPRIRLKELAVSKLHACVYWDAWGKKFSVLDMGSKHGTFVNGRRLSPSRSSSIPTQLSHLAVVQLGTTTFSVHIHEDMLPCGECSALADGSNEIALRFTPLGVPETSNTTLKRKAEASGTGYLPKEPTNSKKALTHLKRDLMSRHASPQLRPSDIDTTSPYVDRSAKRRALHTASSSDAPGVYSTPRLTDQPSTPTPPPLPLEPTVPPAPLGSSNVGYQLLMKQGWTPGSGLSEFTTDGKDGIGVGEGRKEPLQLASTVGRRGLGMTCDPRRTNSGYRNTKIP